MHWRMIMGKKFNIDNPIWSFIGKLVDMLFITLLWVVFSLPLVTIGASTTALYYCSQQLVSNTEEHMAESFVASFRKNFRQSTITWGVTFLSGMILTVDMYLFYYSDTNLAKVMLVVFAVISIIVAMFAIFMFAMIARYEKNLKTIFIMSLVLSFRTLPSSVFMVVLAGGIISLSVFLFWPLGLFSMGIIGYIHSEIMLEIFRRNNLEKQL